MHAWEVVRLGVDDGAAIAAFFEAARRSDSTIHALPEDAFRAWAARSKPDLGGVRQDAALIGFVYSTSSWCGREQRALHHFRAFVLPSLRRQGLGSALLDWVASLPLDGPRPGLQCSSLEDWPAGTGFLERHGFTVFLDDLSMERPTGPVSAPSPPQGISFRRYDDDRDAAAVVRVHAAAYAADPVFQEMSIESLRLQSIRDGFGLLLAVDEGAPSQDDIVGFCLTLGPKNGDGPHVESIAVHPSAARRGIGRALLRQTLSDGSVADQPPATLDVHADNPARGLYESEGFSVVDREFTYRRDLPL